MAIKTIYTLLFAFFLTLASGALIPLDERATSQPSVFNRVVVANSPTNYTSSGTLYARSVQLPDSSLLTTFENYSPEPPNVYFPIYRSTDYGKTWSEYSRVQDTTRNFGLRYQPVLYVLPGALGNLPAGTVLLSGSAIPKDLTSTHLELYASGDGGKTWSFVSHICDGGRAYPNNGETPVWEPFLHYANGQLAVFYSDQRDPAHGQKLVHQLTSDGVNWGSVVNDVTESYNQRPGMPIIAQLKNGNWIMVFEDVNNPQDGNAPVYYKISPDRFSWGSQTAIALNAGGNVPRSSPYVVVTSTGRVIVSGGQGTQLYVSDSNAAANSWRVVNVPFERAYTRSLTLFTGKGSTKQYLMVTGGGWFGNGPNQVVVGVTDPASL